MKHILCLIGLHDWDGNTEEGYPAPHCKRKGCGKKYRRWFGRVVQQNIVCGGDVCAGDIIHQHKPTPKLVDPVDNWREVEQKQKALIQRVMSIVTEEEKKTIPSAVSDILSGGWSPATTRLALNLVKDQIGEDEKYRKYLAEKWIKFWNDNPEIHF